VVLYQMLCGRPPFIGAGIGELIHQHLGATPPPLSALVPQLRPDTAALVERLLCKSAAERPTMQQVVVELTELQSLTEPAEEPRRELAGSAQAPARDEVKGLLANLLGAEPEPESDSASTSKSQPYTDVKWQPRATPRAQPAHHSLRWASKSSPAEAASRSVSRLLYAGGLLCLLGLGGLWGGSRSRGSHANADAGAFPKNVGALPVAPKVDPSPQASSPRQLMPSATIPAPPPGMEQPSRRVPSARAASPLAVPPAQATPPPAPLKRPAPQRPVFRIIDD
jgi:serine/threonine protein kinase